MQNLRKVFSQNIIVLLGFPSSKCLAKVKSLKYICAMKHYIGTIVSFPSVKVAVECLNVQGCGEGRSDLGLQTKLLLWCLNFSDWAGHSSFIQSSFCQPLLSFSKLIVHFDIFSWLLCSFPLHWVCSDCPIKPSITPEVNPHLAAFPCSHLRLFAVQTFLLLYYFKERSVWQRSAKLCIQPALQNSYGRPNQMNLISKAGTSHTSIWRLCVWG